MNVRSRRIRHDRGAQHALLLGCFSVLLAACRTQQAGRRAGIDSAELVQRALEAAGAGDWNRAADAWTDVFTVRNDQDEQACLAAARALSKLERHEEAIDILQRGLRHDADDHDLLVAKGEALRELGFRRSAEHCFERALAAEGDRVEALVALGRLRMELDREEAAIAPLGRAIELGCDDPEVLALFARAHRDAGDPLRAWEAYRGLLESPAALEGVPDDERVRYWVEGAGLSSRAEVVAADPHAPSLGRAWLERALELEPEHADARCQRGVWHEHAGRTDEAEADYRAALESSPDHLSSLTNLACLCRRTARAAEARQLLGRALGLEKDRQRRRALVALLEECEEEARAMAAHPSESLD